MLGRVWKNMEGISAAMLISKCPQSTGCTLYGRRLQALPKDSLHARRLLSQQSEIGPAFLFPSLREKGPATRLAVIRYRKQEIAIHLQLGFRAVYVGRLTWCVSGYWPLCRNQVTPFRCRMASALPLRHLVEVGGIEPPSKTVFAFKLRGCPHTPLRYRC